MTEAASARLSPGAAVATRRVISSRRAVTAGSESVAIQRVTMSRSVTMPRRFPAASTMGSAPMLWTCSSREASAAVHEGGAVREIDVGEVGDEGRDVRVVL